MGLKRLHQRRNEMSNEKKLVVLEHLGHNGAMIGGSKGQYRYNNPDNLIVFNANVVTKEGEKIWYGDLDLSANNGESELVLRRLAVALNTRLYVLYEMDARFENETSPKFENAPYSTDGEVSNFSPYFERVGGIIKSIKDPEPTEAEKEAKVKRLKESYNQSEFKKFEVIEDGEIYEDFYVDSSVFIKTLAEDHSPIHGFWDYVQEVTGLKGEAALSQVWVTKETADEIKRQNGLWYDLYHGLLSTEYRKQSDLGFLWFNHGPADFQETPDWAEECQFYIRKPREEREV